MISSFGGSTIGTFGNKSLTKVKQCVTKSNVKIIYFCLNLNICNKKHSKKTMQTYNAHCHCGKISFRFRSPHIETGRRCNCSICVRKGAVMSTEYIAPEHVENITGSETLSKYQFGDHLVNHYFCSRCGIYPFHESILKPGHYRINLGCVEGIDPLLLKIDLIDGRSF